MDGCPSCPGDEISPEEETLGKVAGSGLAAEIVDPGG
jgi:hypothetical protein